MIRRRRSLSPRMRWLILRYCDVGPFSRPRITDGRTNRPAPAA